MWFLVFGLSFYSSQQTTYKHRQDYPRPEYPLALHSSVVVLGKAGGVDLCNRMA